MKQKLKGKRQKSLRISKVFAIAGIFVLLLLLPVIVLVIENQQNTSTHAQTAGGWPTTPPAQICGNANFLNGPSTPPTGAVTVPAGDNTDFFNSESYKGTGANGTIYWFAPGTHTLGTSQFGQIVPATNTTFVGAPGAILDGQNSNAYAFTQHATGVTIRYLTVKNFVSPRDQGVVNHDGADNWTIEYNTITNNGGAGVFAGTNNVIRYNCLTSNSQYGFQGFSATGPSNITIDHNEISFNNTGDWETQVPGCGCTGGGKFWNVNGARVTNNWVHDNKSVGLWADTNDRDFLFDGNYIENNDSQGIMYEISYNATIRNNTIKHNALVMGKSFSDRGDSFPIGSVYLSESGGDARVSSTIAGSPLIDIHDNNFDNNWGGVVVWENADRFCSSPNNTSGGFCTIGGTATLANCVQPGIGSEPLYSDCRWKSQNVKVHDNVFTFDKATIGCTTNFCGRQSVLSNSGSSPSWSPYMGNVIQKAITFNQQNLWSNNTYIGPWTFGPFDPSTIISFAAWQAAPYNQDAGSTYNGLSSPTNVPGVPTATTTTVPVGVATPTSIIIPTAIPTVSAGGPTVPQNLHTTNVTATSVNLAWNPSTDSVSTISGYDVLKNGVSIGTTGGNTITDNNVVAGQTITYTVYAYDAAFNHSAQSSPINVTIPTNTTATATPAPTAVQSANVLDSNTSTLEGSIGKWINWFSSAVSQSTSIAHSGTHSLQVTVTAPYGWGIQLSNWPGFAAKPGNKTISFWGVKGTGSSVGATMQIQWFNTSRKVLQTNQISISSLTNNWQKAQTVVNAPAGTSTVSVVFTGKGNAGTIFYLDDIMVSN